MRGCPDSGGFLDQHAANLPRPQDLSARLCTYMILTSDSGGGVSLACKTSNKQCVPSTCSRV